MSYFGQSLKTVQEYKPVQANLFEEYKSVLEGRTPKKEFLGLIMNWYGNNANNVLAVNEINNYSYNNMHFFVVDDELLCHKLVLTVDRRIRFIKYPKKSKEEHELNFLVPYIKRYYGWSDHEWEMYKGFFNLEDPELHRTLDAQFVFEKDEARKVGIKREKITAKFEGKIKKGWF